MDAELPELDRWLPEYRWSTCHTRVVTAAPADTMHAFTGLTPADLRISGPLFALRALPSTLLRRGDAGLARDAGPMRGDGPVWDSMLDAGFLALETPVATDATGIATLGFVGRPWRLRLSEAVRRDVTTESFVAFAEPGYVKGLTGVAVRAHALGSMLVTQTRVYATSGDAERRFAPYWRLVHPFSSLMRREMLAAVAVRAQREA